MTITSEVGRVAYAGDGASTQFTVPFKFFQSSDLRVILQSANGVDSELTENVDYTVSGAGDEGGGTVTLAKAPASGQTLTIILDPPRTQLTDYVSNDAFPAESHERALDRLTQQNIRAHDIVRRALRLPDGDPNTLATLPGAAARANKFLRFDNNGDPEMAVGIDQSQTLSRSVIGQFLYPQTPDEVAAGVTPTNYAYPPGDVRRYHADLSTAVAIAEMLGGDTGPAEIVIPAGTYTLTSAIRITRWRKKLIVSPGAKIIVPSGMRAIEVDGGVSGIQQVEVWMLGEIEGQPGSLDGLWVKNVGKCRFVINDIHAMGRDGIRLDEGIISSEFNFRRIQGCGGWGLNMSGANSSNGVIANLFEGELQACVSGGMLAFYALGNRINIVSEGHTGPGLVLDSSMYNTIQSYFEANGSDNHDVILRATGSLECAFNEFLAPTSFHDTKSGSAWNIDLQNGTGATVHDNTIGMVFTTGSGQILRIGSAVTATYIDGARIPSASITNNAPSSELSVRRQSSNTFNAGTVEGTWSIGGLLLPISDNVSDIGSAALRWRDLNISGSIRFGPSAPVWLVGSGSPEGVVAAVVGSLYTRTDGGASTTLYVKESGSSTTGWVAK